MRSEKRRSGRGCVRRFWHERLLSGAGLVKWRKNLGRPLIWELGRGRADAGRGVDEGSGMARIQELRERIFWGVEREKGLEEAISRAEQERARLAGELSQARGNREVVEAKLRDLEGRMGMGAKMEVVSQGEEGN